MNLGDLALHGIGNIGGGGTETIKSLQRGTYTIETGTTHNVSISPVDLEISVVFINYTTDGVYAEPRGVLISAELKANEIELVRNNQSGGIPIIVEWVVVEFNNVKSVQRGLLGSVSSSAGTTVSISNIKTAKSLLFFSFRSSSNSNASMMTCMGKIEDEETLRFKAPSANNLHWQLVEFK